MRVVVALACGLVVVVVGAGFSSSTPLRDAEEAAVAVVVVGACLTVLALVAVRMGGWRDPESEEDFDDVVKRAERLGRAGLAADPGEDEFLELDPLDDDDFDELVRDALDDLPELLLNALRHVAVVISDDGARRRAYGLYEGDGVARDNHPDRIVIFRDTLRRDFGHDAQLLHDQVVRTVRHELAHHVGFDELGVSRLDL